MYRLQRSQCKHVVLGFLLRTKRLSSKLLMRQKAFIWGTVPSGKVWCLCKMRKSNNGMFCSVQPLHRNLFFAFTQPLGPALQSIFIWQGLENCFLRLGQKYSIAQTFDQHFKQRPYDSGIKNLKTAYAFFFFALYRQISSLLPSPGFYSVCQLVWQGGRLVYHDSWQKLPTFARSWPLVLPGNASIGRELCLVTAMMHHTKQAQLGCKGALL